MGSEAICNARVTDACRSEAKLLDPVVVVCGVVIARLVDSGFTELVLIEIPPAKNETGP
jgi:hypothetical protein